MPKYSGINRAYSSDYIEKTPEEKQRELDEKMKKFLEKGGKVEKVKPISEKFGGEYIVRGGETRVLEGTWAYPRTVVIKFPSYEKALEWYNSDEYKPIKQIRLENSIGNGIIIKGV